MQPATTPNETSNTTPNTIIDDATHYKRVLRELVDRASDMARLIHEQTIRQAEAASAALPPPPAPNPFPDPAGAFDRTARTIRRTILLAQKLDEPPKLTNRTAARKRILREVEDVIQRNAKPADRPSLQTELLDRLDSQDLEDDIDIRPLDDIITDIVHDLRVACPYATNWKRRTPQEVEALRIRAAAIPKTWSQPSRPPAPLPKRPKPPNPSLAAHHEDPAQILAEYARIKDTG